MTKEEKSLLLRELSARLSYGVKCKLSGVNAVGVLSGIEIRPENKVLGTLLLEGGMPFVCHIESMKPYLFPLKSMTSIQKDIYDALTRNPTVEGTIRVMEWLNCHSFDYRGLIEKGLAIDATELNAY